MEFINTYGNNGGEFDQDEDISWQADENMEGAGPGDYNKYSTDQFYNQSGSRMGGGYGQGRNGPSRFFCPRWIQGQSGQFMWGKGFGPGGPPVHQRYSKDKVDKPLRYLLRCGVPKENLKGLPKVLLRLMEPHYCGLCAMELSNVTGSRLHYISKNHIKNQKKWLSQNAEVGSHHPREIPLKSRDLYCELCDVHITSKTHADSHYSGKPHRAIVEGRKNPKNPFLLQKGMQNRVEQLIRRERKNLKPVDSAEAAVEEKKEFKPIQPELYCDICKTSVTCSEQMTMHLNGKRHLSKEKQHILKMMKVGANDVEDKPAEEGDANKAGESDQAKDTKEDDDEYDDAWENGDGTWDDDPQ